jgi:TATA-box binding protein (TBP) (component of TFIID and TFIIIB)
MKILRPEIHIKNIVATHSVGFRINIEKFAKLNRFGIDEDFPIGVHCRNKKIIGLITVFKSGKIISVGTMTMKETEQNIVYMNRLLNKQRKQIEIREN